MKKLLLICLLLMASIFGKSQNKSEFTVLQWNIWQEGTKVPGGYDAIVNEIVRLKPDFVTFSEGGNCGFVLRSHRPITEKERRNLLFFLQLRLRAVKPSPNNRFPYRISKKTIMEVFIR